MSIAIEDLDLALLRQLFELEFRIDAVLDLEVEIDEDFHDTIVDDGLGRLVLQVLDDPQECVLLGLRSRQTPNVLLPSAHAEQ